LRPTSDTYGRWGFRSGTDFPSARLLDYRGQWQALEASTNPFATVVMAHLKTLETRHAPADRQARKVRLVKGLYDRGLSGEDVTELVRCIDRLMDLPPALDKLFWQEVSLAGISPTFPGRHFGCHPRLLLQPAVAQALPWPATAGDERRGRDESGRRKGQAAGDGEGSVAAPRPLLLP
jgi:hypothetical protein